MWSLTLIYFVFFCSLVFTFEIGLKKPYYDLEQADELFVKYLEKFNKKYDSEEYKYRLEIFKKNLKEINDLNDNSSSSVFGITQFADVLKEELNFGFIDNMGSDDCKNIDYVPSNSTPDSFDWRDKNIITPIENQGPCGSCYAFSAIGNIESHYAMKYNKLISLSKQQIVDCDTTDNGCDGGLMDKVFRYVINNGGVMATDKYPYSAKDGNCAFNKGEVVAKLTDCMVLTIKNEDDMRDALVKYGPLAIAIHADDKLLHYTGGIFHNPCLQSLNHGVLLVGYGTEKGVPYWIIKNSWGTTWGESGYLRLLRGKLQCGVSTYVANSEIE